MMKGRLKGSQMEAHNKFHMQNTYDAPSSDEHHEGTPSIGLDHSPNVAKKVLRMFKYKRKDPQFKMKTSSDSDTYQDEDLAVPEGLILRVGITGYHALPVSFIARQQSRAEL